MRKGVDALSSITDARVAVFVDLDEDGTLDIMVRRTGDQGAGRVLFVQNNFDYDAFFMKAIGAAIYIYIYILLSEPFFPPRLGYAVLNGACSSGWCLPDNGSLSRYHVSIPFAFLFTLIFMVYTALWR